MSTTSIGMLLTGGSHISPSVTEVSPSYLETVFGPGESFDHQDLPTDIRGTTTVVMSNVVVGSRYRVERQGDGSLATPTGNAEGVAADSTVVLTLDFYPPTSANNELRIKVRKATGSPLYKAFDTLVDLSGGAPQSVYVAQTADE